MITIKVGATYKTTHPYYKTLRIISERARAVNEKTGKPAGLCLGFVAQMCDGTYHKPIFLDAHGDWIDDGYQKQSLREMVLAPIARYVIIQDKEQ